MHRINTLSDSRWQYACPTPAQHRDIRVVDGHFECRSCGETFQEIVYLPDDERLRREDIEIVGPEASHQAAFDPAENV